MKRDFTFFAGRPGGFMFPQAKHCSSTNLNARATAVIIFRKWFGREPSFSWGCGKIGMAEASDNRGNFIEITQEHTVPAHIRASQIAMANYHARGPLALLEWRAA